ncbi:uncharacterized protein EDB91DRAFT_1243239 [Suillus paluster]|uniref:uncharacterized protein n=1 Tax=Suillus paluster TaxID=48578 RepID=UPI001B879A11|nr:uncharacterized protein EDB91DRAFT_1243239 [Suillus paluster]KAG1752474.1 hypothetical protein EDB91DRAFT_1243239 [Suillus paluster]
MPSIAVRCNTSSRAPSPSHIFGPSAAKTFPCDTPQRRGLFRYLRKFLPSRTNAVPPVQNSQPRDPLNFPVTSPLPPNYFSSVQATTRRFSHLDPQESSRSTPPPLVIQSSATTSTTFMSLLHNLSTWWPVRPGHPFVDVPLAQGKERNAGAGAPKINEGWIRDEDYIPSTPPSSNPDSQQPSAAAQITTGEHGSGRLCGCF